MFLLLHEMTHLTSRFNNQLFERKDAFEEFSQYKKVQKNEDMTEWDVVRGLVAIEEVFAQWCCEKCDEAMTGNKKETKLEEHTILGTKINVTTDFSNKDIYAPLEGYVEEFGKSLGFKNIEEFAKSMITGKEDLFEMINESNVERLGYIGILLEGIYQENGFADFGLPDTDIPKAIKYLESRRNNFPVPQGDEIR